MKYLVLSLCLLMSQAYAFRGNTDGGGGRGVVCYDNNNNIVSVELLDLYEGKILEGLNPIQSKKSIVEILDQVIDNDINSQDEFRGQSLNYTKQLMKSFRFLPTGVRLKPIDDSGEIYVPASCKIEQLANMQGINRVFIVKDFWDKMNNVNKAALVMHEYIWATHRFAGRKLSKRARRTTARYFADNYTFTQVNPTSSLGKVVCSSSNLDHQINDITVATRFTVIPTDGGYRFEFGWLGGLMVHNTFYSEDSYMNDVFDQIEKEEYTQEEVDYYDAGEFTFDVYQKDHGVTYMVTAETKFTKLPSGKFKKEITLKAIDMEFPGLVINESPLLCYKDDEPSVNDETEDVTNEFVKLYQGIYTESSWQETIEITFSKKWVERYTRQVGREGSTRVPYPTVCGYKKIKQIVAIEKRLNIDNSTDKTTTHFLKYKITGYELDDTINPGSTSKKHCHNFIKERNHDIPNQIYTDGFVLKQGSIILNNTTYNK